MSRKTKIKKRYHSPTVELSTANVDSERSKGVIRLIIMICVLALAYILSVLTTDVTTTNVKMLCVLLFVVAGFLITVLIFYLSVYLSYLVEKIKRRKNVRKEVYALKDFEYVLNKEENVFIYDKGITILENVGRIKDMIFNVVKDVAYKIKGDGNKFYLKFTVSDAIQIALESLDKIRVKTDGFFTKLHLENKPLYIVESSLQKLIEGEKEEELAATDEGGFFGFFKRAKQKAVNIGVNVAVTVFKSSIEKFANDILKSVLIESVKLYSGSEIEVSEDNGND